jgi:hypothetical protein
MKRRHQRTLGLIFARPTSGNIPWRDVEALFLALGAEVSEREGSRIAVVLSGRSGFSTACIPRRTLTRAPRKAFANG